MQSLEEARLAAAQDGVVSDVSSDEGEREDGAAGGDLDWEEVRIVAQSNPVITTCAVATDQV